MSETDRLFENVREAEKAEGAARLDREGHMGALVAGRFLLGTEKFDTARSSSNCRVSSSGSSSGTLMNRT